jgi:hypothetical protein
MIEDISNSVVLNHIGFWEHRHCELCDGAFARKLDTEAPIDTEEDAKTRSRNRFIVKMVMKEPCTCNRK